MRSSYRETLAHLLCEIRGQATEGSPRTVLILEGSIQRVAGLI